MRFKNQDQPDAHVSLQANGMSMGGLPVNTSSPSASMPLNIMPAPSMPASAGIPVGGMSPCGGYNHMGALPTTYNNPVPAQAMPGQMAAPPIPMPSGFATGPTTTPLLPSATGVPAVPVGEQPPVTVQSPLFTPGFLKTQIGRRMRVEFLIGTNMLTDRTGTLVGVGASYILLQPIDSDDVLMCDIYSIKFVTIIL